MHLLDGEKKQSTSVLQSMFKMMILCPVTVVGVILEKSCVCSTGGPFTWQVWHIKILIAQHGAGTG